MKLNFGLVGTGAAAQLHVDALNKIKGAQVKAVYNRSSGKGQKFAKEWNLDFVEEYEGLIGQDGIDVVDICTATGTHSRFAVVAAKAGKNLVIEKPLETTPEKCEKIIDAARENEVRLSVIFQNRFKDSVQIVRKALDRKRLGRPVLGEAEVKWFRSPEYYKNNWKGTKEMDGGGALINQSIHTIDLLQWLMGEVTSVRGSVKTLVRDIEGEDVGAATLEFANGAVGVINGSTAIYPGLDERLGLYGTKGSIELEGSRINTWEFANKDELMESPKLNDAEPGKSGASNATDIDSENHRRQLQEIVDCLNRDDNPPVSGKEAKKSVQIINAIYESSSTGNEVEMSKIT